MALFSTLTALSQTPGSNPPDGATDAPSTIDDQLRSLGSFSALLRDGAHVYVASVAGTNTITGSIATNPTSYTVGQAYRFVAAGANTGAVTLNFNSIGAKALLRAGNAALTGGELQSTCVYEVIYDGVSFQLVNTHASTLGYAQTWQDVSASRAAGTTYTNSTGRPIAVSITSTPTNLNDALKLTVGGVVLFGSSNGAVGAASSISAVIPPSATYVLSSSNNGTAGVGTIRAWAELR